MSPPDPFARDNLSLRLTILARDNSSLPDDLACDNSSLPDDLAHDKFSLRLTILARDNSSPRRRRESRQRG
ncbi:MAG TPA: hypothetical protein ENJ18_14600 [Nannocystis exedens]|nr:hypothetical protein [Nannocystis exedens]